MAGGYQLLTLPEYGEHLKALHQKEVDSKLTKAAVETGLLGGLGALLLGHPEEPNRSSALVAISRSPL